MMATGGVTLTIRSRELEKQRVDPEQLSVGPLKTLGDLVRTLDEGDPFHSSIAGMGRAASVAAGPSYNPERGNPENG